MAKEANLLVTFDPTHEEAALKAIRGVLSEIKDKADIVKSGEGLAEVAVKDAKKAVKQIASLAAKQVEKVMHTSHWVPVDKWCKATVEDMQKNIKDFAKGIKSSEKWRMDLKVRHVKEKPDELKLILKLTESIDKPKVDLQNPDKIIKVEIIGNKAGLALLNKDEIFNAAQK